MAVTNILCQTKRWFLCRHKSFWRGAKCSQILGWLKKLGPAQNILGPVKGQGIRLIKPSRYMPIWQKLLKMGPKIIWSINWILKIFSEIFIHMISRISNPEAFFFYQIESCLFIRWGFFCRSNLMSLKNRENSELGNWATMLNDLLKN